MEGPFYLKYAKYKEKYLKLKYLNEGNSVLNPLEGGGIDSDIKEIKRMLSIQESRIYNETVIDLFNKFIIIYTENPTIKENIKLNLNKLKAILQRIFPQWKI